MSDMAPGATAACMHVLHVHDMTGLVGLCRCCCQSARCSQTRTQTTRSCPRLPTCASLLHTMCTTLPCRANVPVQKLLDTAFYCTWPACRAAQSWQAQMWCPTLMQLFSWMCARRYKTDKKRYDDTARQWTNKYAMG